ncbi:MAG: beta-Ala-His dipeptidase [Clostridiales bacterium]|jgi:dipeptidase D|nr:beta-Ala-His dipeptidase [Clostridiales bacterium]
MAELNGLEPRDVFGHFLALSAIPRGSGNERGAADYVAGWAADKGFGVRRDGLSNVVADAPASKGYEGAPTVIIQAHLDMVCEKDGGSRHDFTRDPLELYIDGEWLRARGTTLGADDGIGVALAMAVAEDVSAVCPPLRLVFTTDEEVGMGGAKGLDVSGLAGARYLINIDNSDEDEVIIGCAGGVISDSRFAADRVPVPEDYGAVFVSVSGLAGGHSGGDIHLGRANANVAAARIVNELYREYDIYIKEVTGGEKDNAIPRECSVTLFAREPGRAAAAARAFGRVIAREYAAADPGLTVSADPITVSDYTALSPDLAGALTAFALLAPCGVISARPSDPSMIETSSNIGVIRAGSDGALITCLSRSYSESRLADTAARIRLLADALGGSVSARGEYPGWEPDPGSKLAALFAAARERLTGRRPAVRSVHAGLECGIFARKLPGLDMVSVGPRAEGIHSPNERLFIPSVGRARGTLASVLREIAQEGGS